MTPTSVRRKVLKTVLLLALGMLFIALADLFTVTHQSVRQRLVMFEAFSRRFDLKTFRKEAGETFAAPVSKYFREGPAAFNWDPFEFVLKKQQALETPIERKTLVVEVNPERLVARFHLRLPKAHPIFEEAQTAVGQRHAAHLVEGALGSVKVNNVQVSFVSLHSDFTEEGETGNLVIVSERISNPGLDPYDVSADFSAAPLQPPVGLAEVFFDTTKTQVGSYDASPVSRSMLSTRYVVEPYRSYSFHVGVEPAARGESRPGGEGASPTIADFLSKRITIPVAGTLLAGLYESLPYLLFLWWARRYAATAEARSAGGYVESSAAVVKLYLIFHAGYFFLLTADDAYMTFGNPALLALDRLQTAYPLPFWPGIAKFSQSLIPALALSLYAWPSSVRRWESRGEAAPARSRREAAWWAVLLALAAALVVWVAAPLYGAWLYGYGNLSVADFYRACYGVLMLGLLAASVCLAFGLFAGGRARGAILCFAAFALVVTLKFRTGVYRVDLATSWTVYTAAAVSLVAAFLRLTFDLLAGRPFAQFWRGDAGVAAPADPEGAPRGARHVLWRLRKPLIAVGVLLVALSFRRWEADLPWWPLWSLGAELRGFFLLALGGMLVLLLKRMAAGQYWERLPDPVYHAGLLLALLMFFSPSGWWWFYVPVPFVLGYFMLDRWLLNKREYEEDLIPKVKRRVGEIVLGVIEYNEAVKLSRSLRKEMPARIGKGEVEYATYKKKLKEVADDAEARRQEMLIDGRDGKDLVFSFGPTDSPWKNGLIGAKYSLYISVFWFLLYLRSIVNAPAPQTSYAVLNLLNLALSFLATWTAYGFFFGYFYPYLRGTSGYRKGLFFFFALSVPYLITQGLSSPADSANWVSFAFWQLQLLTHMVLLGLLAGDLETLRRAHLKVGHLLQFYRLSSLTAWATTLVIAVGGAITTLIASGATQVLALALKQMGVIPSEIELPKK